MKYKDNFTFNFIMTSITSATLYFDGCSKGNPGPAGSGAMIKYDNENMNDISLCEYVGNTTNNVAEYKGLILGLKYLKEVLMA